ncbi:MAG: molybdopterin-dependent oxidoreductase [Gemmataceae bacterium]|nr:molybdopterin-dependent oxidoreductase [Gemmataceae bacterium]
MPTVYVSHDPASKKPAPANAIAATVGQDALKLVPVEIGDAKLNCIQAARRAGVEIPHYCWHPALSVVASCRMCLVEVGERKPDGTVAMGPRVVPGCQTPVKDGTVIVPDSHRAKTAQADTLEGILINHPLDCPVCDKAGECMLQDFTYSHGRSHTRMIDQKNTPPNKPDLGPNVSLFTDRCIMCSRCVRFTREVSGEAELMVVNRGDRSEIDVFPGEPLDNKLASNVVDLCPVGALCSNDFLYKHRVWNLKTVPSVCPDCSTGCSIHLDANKSIVYRLRPRENPKSQGYFMCDDGRLGYHYANSKDRYLRPMSRQGGELKPLAWKDAHAGIRAAFKAAGASAVGIVSPFLTCEEAFLLCKWIKAQHRDAKLALGPVPVVGEDDTYPKDRRGSALPMVKFTIRAEKCPNRKGVAKVLEHFQGRVHSFDEALGWGGKAVYLAGGYPPRGEGWITAEQAEMLKKAGTLVVHDLLPSPASAIAHYVLPAAAWSEKEGTFVNHAGLAQGIKRGATPSGEGRTDAQVFLDLAEKPGLANAGQLRKQLGAEVKWFTPLATAEPGEYGILLEGGK